MADQFELVRTRAPLRDVLSFYTGQEPDRNGYICCPFHGEKTPSFHVRPDRPGRTPGYYCFGCGWTGSVIDFVMQKNNTDALDAARDINDTFGLGADFRDFADIREYAQRRARDRKLNDELNDYREVISAEVIQDLDRQARDLADGDSRAEAERKAREARWIVDNGVLFALDEYDPEGSVERMREAVEDIVGTDATKEVRDRYHPEMRTKYDDIPDAVNLDDVPEVDETPFLWYPYIPMQEVTILAAPGGTGKGMLFTLLAARLSTGFGFSDVEYERCPDRQRAIPDGVQATTLILSKEDGAVRILPRFLVSNGDKRYLKIVDDTLYDRNNKEFLMRLNVGSDDGCAELERWIRKFDPKLVILDPVTSFMPGKRLNNGDDTRAVLSNLTRIARVTNTAIIAVTHTRKGSKDDVAMTDLIAGSHEIKDVARSVLMIGYDIEDDRTLDDFDYRTPRRLMYHVKSNHAELGKTVRYYIHTGKQRQGGGRFPTSESGFSAFSDVTAEVLERTPHGTLPALYWKRIRAEREAKQNSRQTLPAKLWNALTAVMNDMKEHGREEYRIGYKTFEEMNGGDIWSGPRKAGDDLTKCSVALAAHGFAVILNQAANRGKEKGFILKVINK